jgi:hypothetical protein
MNLSLSELSYGFVGESVFADNPLTVPITKENDPVVIPSVFPHWPCLQCCESIVLGKQHPQRVEKHGKRSKRTRIQPEDEMVVEEMIHECPTAIATQLWPINDRVPLSPLPRSFSSRSQQTTCNDIAAFLVLFPRCVTFPLRSYDNNYLNKDESEGDSEPEVEVARNGR